MPHLDLGCCWGPCPPAPRSGSFPLLWGMALSQRDPTHQECTHPPAKHWLTGGYGKAACLTLQGGMTLFVIHSPELPWDPAEAGFRLRAQPCSPLSLPLESSSPINHGPRTPHVSKLCFQGTQRTTASMLLRRAVG